MTKWLKNEEGSGLVLAIMTLLVLSVLGASLGTITLSGHQMSNVNRDSSSAYYIAEAGANMAYEEIKDIVTEVYEESSNRESFYQALDSLIEVDFDTYDDFSSQFGQQPQAIIKVSEETNGDTRSYIIESKANIGNHSRTAQKEVTVNWVNKDNGGGALPPLPEGAALIANSSISFTNGQITGDVYFNSSESNSFEISDSGTVSSNTSNVYMPDEVNNQIFYGSASKDTINNYIDRLFLSNTSIQWNDFEGLIQSFPEFSILPPSVNYPELSDYLISDSGGDNTHKIIDKGNVYHNSWIKNNFSISLEENIKFNNIVVASGKNLIIDTGDHDLNIAVDNIKINHGSLIVKGTGNINIFINNDLFINGNSNSDALIFENLGEVNIYTNNYTHQNGNSISINTDLVSFYVKNDIKFIGGKINNRGNNNLYRIYYANDHIVNFGDYISINSSLFFEKSSIIISAGVNISGPILTGGSTVELSGGGASSPLLIAPYANAELSGGGDWKGVLVIDNISLTGGTQLEYLYYDSNTFPFGNLENDGNLEINLGDIINSKPVLEP